jgi:hypothetical protein
MTNENTNLELKNTKINLSTMVDETGKVIKISDTKNEKQKRLTMVTINETFFSVYIPSTIEVAKFSQIHVVGDYQNNTTEDKVFHSIFLNTYKKGHSLCIITESENLLESA